MRYILLSYFDERSVSEAALLCCLVVGLPDGNADEVAETAAQRG